MTYTSLLQYEVGLQALLARPRDLIELANPNCWAIFGGIAAVVLIDVLFIAFTHEMRMEKVSSYETCVNTRDQTLDDDEQVVPQRLKTE